MSYHMSIYVVTVIDLPTDYVTAPFYRLAPFNKPIGVDMVWAVRAALIRSILHLI